MEVHQYLELCVLDHEERLPNTGSVNFIKYVVVCLKDSCCGLGELISNIYDPNLPALSKCLKNLSIQQVLIFPVHIILEGLENQNRGRQCSCQNRRSKGVKTV